MPKSKTKKSQPLNKNIPRFLAITYTLFISIFALDAGSIVGLIMHLVPTFILILITAVAWKNERIGGILFLILGLIFTFFFHTTKELMSFVIISAPLMFIGVTFLAASDKS